MATGPELNTEDQNLTEILHDMHRVKHLGEQMKQDIKKEIESLSEQISSFRDLTTKFIAHMDLLEGIGDNIKLELNNSIADASQQIAEKAALEFTSSVEKKVSSTIMKLETATQEATHSLNEAVPQKRLKTALFIFLACISFLGVGFGSGYVFMQKNTYVLTDTALKRMQWGLIMEDAWPHLSEAEQKKILRKK